MRPCWGILAIAAFAIPLPASALTLDLPGAATLTAERTEALGSYRLPLGPWTVTGFATETVEGQLHQSAWRLESRGLTTLQLLAPLREQLTALGFRTVYECETEVCGGFDFRYSIEVLPEPDMHVDLGDFRFLAARREKDGAAEAVGLLVSRASATGFVQVFHVGKPEDGAAPVTLRGSTKSAASNLAGVTAPLAVVLDEDGRAPLDDLVFATGSATLDGEEFASLSELADYLSANPERTVTLVGHTDAVGALESNVALSKRRAQSVRKLLVDRYAVNGAQVAAEGAGYLAPRASNLTEAGRTQNRRVEVMLTSTQ